MLSLVLLFQSPWNNLNQIDNDLHEYNMEKKNLKTKTSSNNSIPVNNHPSTSLTSMTPHPMTPRTEVVPIEIDASFQN